MSTIQVTHSEDSISQAKLAFMAYLKTSGFQEIAGSISTLAEVLRGISSDAKEDPKIAFKQSGRLISEILLQSEENGLLDKSIAIVFFSMEREGQISFVADLSKKIITYASRQARRPSNVTKEPLND